MFWICIYFPNSMWNYNVDKFFFVEEFISTVILYLQNIYKSKKYNYIDLKIDWVRLIIWPGVYVT